MGKYQKIIPTTIIMKYAIATILAGLATAADFDLNVVPCTSWKLDYLKDNHAADEYACHVDDDEDGMIRCRLKLKDNKWKEIDFEKDAADYAKSPCGQELEPELVSMYAASRLI